MLALRASGAFDVRQTAAMPRECNDAMRPFRSVHVSAGGFTVEGDFHTTRNALGVVVVVHGSGVTRRERRNDTVARRLENVGFATLLVDLLEEAETRDRHNVFDVEMQ